MEAALARSLGDDCVAREHLDELGMHLHAHRVVPAGDVAHRAGQRLAACQLAISLGEVPVDAIECAINVGAGEAPRLADLPDEQQCQQAPMLAHGRDGARNAHLALLEINLRPRRVLAHSAIDCSHGLVMVDARRALDLGTVDGVLMLARNAGAHPLAVDQVADAIRVEGLGGHRNALRVGLGPAGSGLENE